MTTLQQVPRRDRGPARLDARDKVRGVARFASDDARPELAHAMLAVATINRGRLTALDVSAARAVPGVLLVLTHEDMVGVRSADYSFAGGYGVQGIQPMTDTAIAYRGQPIACVVADTLEAAVEGASLVRAEYAPEAFAVTLDSPGATVIPQAEPPLEIPDIRAGDPDGELASAAARVDAVYDGPPQHPNPMELIATVAEWRDGHLVVHEGTQNVGGVKHGLAVQLGIPPEQVRLVSPFIGGGFGQKGFVQVQTVIAAVAARALGRPVKLVVPRAQLFHNASFRPASRHRIRLGADASGRMLAAIHEIDHQTSRHDLFPAQYAELTARLYGISHFRARERLVQNDIQTPGYMRGPFQHPAAFAFESAVDELAAALGRDPVALRLASDANADAITGKPLSSRHLAECLHRGARRFGWDRRSPEPRSMRGRDGTLIGWGVAAGGYPSAIAPAIASLRATDDGAITVSVGVHEMGQGARNAIAAPVAEALGVRVADVTTLIGDTAGPPHHLTAGSWGTATAVPAVRNAALDMLAQLRELDPRAGRGRTPAQVLRAAGRRFLAVEARHQAPGQPEAAFGDLAQGRFAAVGPEFEEFVSFSYSAHFVEVRVEPHTRRIRLPRVVSVVDCGRVLSPQMAVSQVRGSVIWGIGAALREISEIDTRYGGFVNADFAEYVIPVNADIGEIEVDFIDEPDTVLTPTGIKNAGQIGMIGVAPAIANAIWHATGRRFRHLPIRVDDLFA
jgi:xanthine dehydrogenase YagR molybdenum-binding subunit